ncbi:MAG: hypothetical protein LBG17_01045 [Bacteroidales bacterium]|nr:hypothetical protein [Bacteroidales bacterium]
MADRIKYIYYYAIVLVLLSLIGTEIYYVPICDFKLSAYRFFLAFLPVVCCFIPYKEFIANLKYGMGWFGAYLLLAWLPHAFFSVYWDKDFTFTDNIIFFVGAMLTALLLTGTSTNVSVVKETSADTKRKNFLKVFYAVETGVCILGLICLVQYLFNYIYTPAFSVSLLDQNLPEITLLGQENYLKVKWWNENANVFLFASFVMPFIGYLLDKKNKHLILSAIFIVIYFFP